MKELWTEKYRPSTLEDYVFRDDEQRQQVQAWVKDGSIPHLLFSGAPGVGKTTLAKILINELKIDAYDVLEINASRENSVDTIRDMCISYRSDYDLNRSLSDPPWVAGLTPKERMGLWRTMEQIYEINIASKMEIKK